MGLKRVNVMVDDPAKANLLNYQKKHSYSTQDETVQEILHNVPKWEAKIKTLEGKLQELEAKLRAAGVDL